MVQLLCSTFGRKLAALYGIDFIDADDYHPASNVGGHMIITRLSITYQYMHGARSVLGSAAAIIMKLCSMIFDAGCVSA